VETIISLKRADREADLPIWEWLSRILNSLGPDGMSSEESCTEGDIETIYRVKILAWRRDIEKELTIIDRQRVLDSDIFSPRGSKPVKRLRGTGTHASERDPVVGLPRPFYDDEWYQSKSADYRELTLNVSKEQFKWITVLA
jgi:hypothetical protein